MARITVEDCAKIIPNRFELCLIASNRAKGILSGAPTVFDRKEKPSVIALREIAEGVIDPEVQKKSIIKSMRNRGIVNPTSSNEEVSEIIAEETEESLNLKDTTFIEENIQLDD